MLSNAYFLAKIGADTAENEQHFAEILPKIGTDLTPPPFVDAEDDATQWEGDEAHANRFGGRKKACALTGSGRTVHLRPTSRSNLYY